MPIGIPDHLDEDDDKNGIPDTADQDDNGDGIPDNLEIGSIPSDFVSQLNKFSTIDNTSSFMQENTWMTTSAPPAIY